MEKVYQILIRQNLDIELLPGGLGYDRAITVFSPDGRLFQVDYAMVMVNNSPTAFGVSSENGIVLGGIEKKTDALQDRRFSHKIFLIDEHVATVVAGFTSDARMLVDIARQEAQVNRLLYEEPIDLDYLARRLSDIIQTYTQNAGVRPFGVSLIIGGVDLLGPAIYQIDPAGVYNKYFLTAAGVNRNEAIETTKTLYNKSLSLESLKELATRGLIGSNKADASAEIIRMAYADAKDRKLVMAEESEVSEIFNKASQAR